MFTLDISGTFHEGAGWKLRCGRCFGIICVGLTCVGLGRLRLRHLGRLRRLCREFVAEGVGRDVVDRAGSAFHLIATTLQELNELFVLHSYFFGKLVYTNTHV